MPPEFDMTTSHVPSYLPTHDHIQKEETVHLQPRDLLGLVHAAFLTAGAKTLRQWLLRFVSAYSLSSPKVYLLCKNRLRFCSQQSLSKYR